LAGIARRRDHRRSQEVGAPNSRWSRPKETAPMVVGRSPRGRRRDRGATRGSPDF
jgi:hypothetical protein